MNRFLPNIYILPEDDANRGLANGFLLEITHSAGRQVKILPAAGGWKYVVDKFKKNHLHAMQQNPKRFIVLLLDFDNKENRLKEVLDEIPEDVKERVFVLGAWSDPENLSKSLRQSEEELGEALAKECRARDFHLWNDGLLKHNQTEIKRMDGKLHEILFS